MKQLIPSYYTSLTQHDIELYKTKRDVVFAGLCKNIPFRVWKQLPRLPKPDQKYAVITTECGKQKLSFFSKLLNFLMR